MDPPGATTVSMNWTAAVHDASQGLYLTISWFFDFSICGRDVHTFRALSKHRVSPLSMGTAESRDLFVGSWIRSSFGMSKVAHDLNQQVLVSFPLACSVHTCIQKGFLDLSPESGSRLRCCCIGRSGAIRILLYSKITATSRLMLTDAMSVKTRSHDTSTDLRQSLTILSINFSVKKSVSLTRILIEVNEWQTSFDMDYIEALSWNKNKV